MKVADDKLSRLFPTSSVKEPTQNDLDYVWVRYMRNEKIAETEIDITIQRCPCQNNAVKECKLG